MMSIGTFFQFVHSFSPFIFMAKRIVGIVGLKIMFSIIHVNLNIKITTYQIVSFGVKSSIVEDYQ